MMSLGCKLSNTSQSKTEVFDIPLPPGDEWHHLHGQMKLPKTHPDTELNNSDKKCPGQYDTLVD
jgi:hypothetical protein